MFIWTSIAHMALPLGEAGIREIPNEQAVLAAMKANIGEQSGLYLFPGVGLGPNPSRAQKNEAMHNLGEKSANNPSGILMYHPPGRPLTIGKWLGIEFATELVESMLVVFLLAQTRVSSFGGRVGFVFVAGILAAMATLTDQIRAQLEESARVKTSFSNELIQRMASFAEKSAAALLGGLAAWKSAGYPVEATSEK